MQWIYLTDEFEIKNQANTASSSLALPSESGCKEAPIWSLLWSHRSKPPSFESYLWLPTLVWFHLGKVRNTYLIQGTCIQQICLIPTSKKPLSSSDEANILIFYLPKSFVSLPPVFFKSTGQKKRKKRVGSLSCPFKCQWKLKYYSQTCNVFSFTGITVLSVFSSKPFLFPWTLMPVKQL